MIIYYFRVRGVAIIASGIVKRLKGKKSGKSRNNVKN